jgi:alkylhydroperoxidase family enzyme
VKALSDGSDWPGLNAAERAMLHYAHELTFDPASVSEEHVSTIRAAGFSDRAILEINLAVAYMNFVNRIAEGLGVEIEPSLAAFRR